MGQIAPRCVSSVLFPDRIDQYDASPFATESIVLARRRRDLSAHLPWENSRPQDFRLAHKFNSFAVCDRLAANMTRTWRGLSLT